jgi:putative cell wall-binding protein
VTRRLLPLLVALALLFAGSPAAGAWTRPPDRIAGADRYETAVRISVHTFPKGAATVVVARGESFADGLAAGPLAALYDAPVLLTQRDALPPITSSELTRLAPTRVLVVGGAAAVGDDVVTAIDEVTGVQPARIAGATRYDTATAVASLFPSPAPVAFVASGVQFADALAGGAAAAVAVAPLLLTPPDSLPQAVGDQLARLLAPETLVLGGPGAVGDDVVGAIDARVDEVRRLAGNDRYETAAAIADDRFPTATSTVMATGADFPDALAAAPLARHTNGPILLTSTCEPAATEGYLRAHDWADVTVVGGSGVVPEFGLSLPCTPVPDGQIAPGITMETRQVGPSVVKVLRLNGAAVRPVTASGHLTGRVTATEIARGNKVPVAVNGTFFDLRTTEPSYALAVAGRLLKAPGAGGTIMATNTAHPNQLLFASPEFTITLGDVTISKVNSGAPGSGETALFTVEDPRPVDVGTDFCRAGLLPTDAPHVVDGDNVQTYEIRSASCSSSDIVADDSDVVAALADTPEGDAIASLPVGDTVELHWRAHDAAADMPEVLGGNLTLVHGGQVATDVTMNSGEFFTKRAARTAIGFDANRTTLIVIVDGRPNHSVGMTPRELADFLVSLGCVDAMNLDGGGSTTLAVNGMLGDVPSDPGGQRPVGTALLVEPAAG